MTETFKRLPDAEFNVLKTIWHLPNPVTSAQILEHLEAEKSWKPQTLLTILARLAEKGFLSSQRNGRIREYTAIISEEEYLEVEASNFFKRYQGNSLGGLVKTLFTNNSFSQEDLEELRDLLK